MQSSAVLSVILLDRGCLQDTTLHHTKWIDLSSSQGTLASASVDVVGRRGDGRKERASTGMAGKEI
eukprot:750429-Hanusia_phi.AAC.4